MHRVAFVARFRADDGGLRRHVWRFWSTISERKSTVTNMHADSACAGKVGIVLNATGQQYRQTTSVTYVWEAPSLKQTPKLADMD